MATLKDINAKGYFTTMQVASLLGVHPFHVIREGVDTKLDETNYFTYTNPGYCNGLTLEECQEHGVNVNGGILWHMIAVLYMATALNTLEARALIILWDRDVERTMLNNCSSYAPENWSEYIPQARQLTALLKDAMPKEVKPDERQKPF